MNCPFKCGSRPQEPVRSWSVSGREGGGVTGGSVRVWGGWTLSGSLSGHVTVSDSRLGLRSQILRINSKSYQEKKDKVVTLREVCRYKENRQVLGRPPSLTTFPHPPHGGANSLYTDVSPSFISPCFFTFTSKTTTLFSECFRSFLMNLQLYSQSLQIFFSHCGSNFPSLEPQKFCFRLWELQLSLFPSRRQQDFTGSAGLCCCCDSAVRVVSHTRDKRRIFLVLLRT